jgi:type IV pilus assembly protein PilA
VNNSVIQLIPLAPGGGTAVFTAGNSQTLFGWRCGPPASSGVPIKFLPGSCRG